MVPKSKLDQDQEFIINQCTTNKQSCCWIQGIAGSGKTVILVYALETLRINNPTRSMCFVTFTHALKDLVRTGLSNQTKNLPILTVDQFIRNNKPYDIVLVDEIQDLPLVKVDKIKSLSGKLVVAGDMDQSIYPGGIQNNEINQILKPETHKLSVLYRLTENLQFLARSLLPTTSIYAAKVASRRNTEVVLAHALNPKEETDWVVERAIMLAKPGSPSLIILPRHDDIIDFIEAVADLKNKKRPERVYEETKYNTNKPKLDYGSINNSLRDVELPIRYLGNSFGSLDEADQKPLTFIMTYHSAKGLDFEHVFCHA